MSPPIKTFIELFAGCGGMSLGFKSVGFKRLLANELSPMPAGTYAFNLVHGKSPDSCDPEQWFTRLCVPDRDGRFPADPRLVDNKISELSQRILEKFSGEMFVGSISQLNRALRKISAKKRRSLNVDVISGGPPCQSFSLAGRREKNNPRNMLPFEFAETAKLMQPKVVVLENVAGIVRPFVSKDGRRWEAWYEVAKAFYKAGYVPICTLSEAQRYGVPQRRPRFVMIAIKKKIAELAIKCLTDSEWTNTVVALRASMKHFRSASPTERLSYIEPSGLWPDALLPLVNKTFVVENVIDDLASLESKKTSAYLKHLRDAFHKIDPSRPSRWHRFLRRAHEWS